MYVHSTEYRDIISSVVPSICYHICSATEDIPRRTIPLLFSMCLMILHIKRESIEYQKPSSCPSGNELSGHCDQNQKISYRLCGGIKLQYLNLKIIYFKSIPQRCCLNSLINVKIAFFFKRNIGKGKVNK